MSNSITINNHVSLIVLLSLLITGTLCDCPITRYHDSIRTGHVKLTQSQLSETQLVQSLHIHTLDTPLVTLNPTVIIGLTGYSYTRSGTIVEFQIVSLANSDMSTLSFEVRSIGAIENQRIFSFRFLAIQRNFNFIQIGTHKGHPTLNPIPTDFTLLSPSLNLNTQVALFLNGFSVTNLLDTWSLQLLSPKLESSQLKYDFFSNLAQDQIETISYSYLLYNKIDYQGKNEVLLQPLQFQSGSSMRVRFNSLQFTDLTFFGLSSIFFTPNLIQSIEMFLDDKSSNDVGLMIQSNQKGLQLHVFIWQSFVKQQFICSFCESGSLLYEQRFCVSQCPEASVPQEGKYMTECKKCLIEDMRVLDPESRKCVCALQHFDNMGTCSPCHFTCLTCTGPLNSECLTCDFSQIRRLKATFRQLVKSDANSPMGTCSCPSLRFYEEDEIIRCGRCHPDCRTCSGPTDEDCILCDKNRVKDELGMCICKSGYSSQSDGQCLCLNPRYEVGGECVDPLNPCGLNEVQVIRNLQGRNNNANNNNRNNNRISTRKVCQCKPGFAKVKGECQPCGLNEEYNEKSGKCRCINGAVKHPTRGCIVCGPETRYDKETEQCICRKKNRFEDSQGNCISCPAKTIFYQDKCECINNYFMNERGRCQKCRRKSENPQCLRYQTNVVNDL